MVTKTISPNRSVIDHLEHDPTPFISFEIIPPLRGGKLEDLERVIADLAEFSPPYIDVTTHPSQAIFEPSTDSMYKRRVIKKRPGTLGVCVLIQNKYAIDAVPHVLCYGYTREETEDFLIELRYSGIRNVLSLQGDIIGNHKVVSPDKTVNIFACDLVEQITNMNQGKYLDDRLQEAEPTDICIGVAGYPEKHIAAPNLEIDIKHLKRKIEAGALYVVTQMFFDNAKYYRFVEQCSKAGIDVPIIPGMKILTSKKQLNSLPSRFYIDIPKSLSDKVLESDSEHVEDVGVGWAHHQIQDLITNGVPSVHLYVMQNTRAVKKLMKKLSFP